MTTDPLQDKLADYLGDEMTADERRDFEHELGQRPDLGQQAEELLDTVAALRQRAVGPVSGPAMARPSLPRREHGHTGWWSYAAAALVAFVAGFIARGAWPGNPTQPVPESSAPRGQAAIVAAYRDAPAESRFGRILIALAHDDRPAAEPTLD